MRDQKTLALASGFETYSKTTRRSRFLEEMDRVVPWQALCQEVEAYYPKAGRGRHPVGLERMLRIYFLQQWFDLSDPGVEEALYDAEHRNEIELFYLPSHSPELNPDECLNADLKQAVTSKAPARVKGQLRKTTIRHLRKLSKSPARVRKYFEHPSVRYAA